MDGTLVASERQQRVERLIERGLERYSRGDLDGAILEWEQALAVDRDTARAREYIDYVRDNFNVLAERFAAAREAEEVANELDVPFGLESTDGHFDREAYEDIELELELGEAGAKAHRPGWADQEVDAGWSLDAEAGGRAAAGSSAPDDHVGLASDLADVSAGLDDGGSGEFDAAGGTSTAEVERAMGFVTPRTADDEATVPGGVERAPSYGGAPRLADEALAALRDSRAGRRPVEASASPDEPTAERSGVAGRFSLRGLDALEEGVARDDRDRAEGTAPAIEFRDGDTTEGPAGIELGDLMEEGGEEQTRERGTRRPATYDAALAMESLTIEVSAADGDEDTLTAEPLAGGVRTRDADDDATREHLAITSRVAADDAAATGQHRAITGLDPAVDADLAATREHRAFSPHVNLELGEPGGAGAHDLARADDVDQAPTTEHRAFSGMDADVAPTTEHRVLGDVDAAPTREHRARGPGHGGPSQIDFDPEAATIERGNVSVSDLDADDQPSVAEARERLIAELEAGEQPGEDEDARTRRRVGWLITRAARDSRLGRHDAAVIALELAFGEHPDSAITQKLIHRHRDELFEIYQLYIGDIDATPAVAVPLHALAQEPLDSRAAFLLSRIDGTISFDEVLDVSGMSRLEGYRHLCGLLLRGILEIR